MSVFLCLGVDKLNPDERPEEPFVARKKLGVRKCSIEIIHKQCMSLETKAYLRC